MGNCSVFYNSNKTEGEYLMALTGILIFIIVFCTAVILAGGNLIWFFDIPSFILVFGFIFATLLCAGRIQDFLKGVRLWFSRNLKKEDNLEDCIEALHAAFWASVGSGATGFVLGSILAFVNMPDLTKIGPFLALAFVSVLLGMILAFQVFLPARVSLEKRMIAEGGK
jgi:flagellar motor component MotA